MSEGRFDMPRIAATLEEHKKDILKAARATPQGMHRCILVEPDGTWYGPSQPMTKGSANAAAYGGEMFGLTVWGNPFFSYEDVELALIDYVYVGM